LLWVVPSLALSLDRRLLSLALPLLILVPLQDLPIPFQYHNRLNAIIYLAVVVCWIVNGAARPSATRSLHRLTLAGRKPQQIAVASMGN
jgi:hypothetical protein